MSITQAQLRAGMTPAQAQAALGGQPMLRAPIAPIAPGVSKRGRKSTSKAVAVVGGVNRKVHVGKKGGTYILCKGRKQYLKAGEVAHCSPRKYKKRRSTRKSTAVRKYKKRSGGRKRVYACSAGRKLKGGRKMHTGKNGGRYYICRGQKVYVTKARKTAGRRRVYKKRRTVKRKSYGKPCKSRYGRKLHTGKNGGKFYMCKGRRVYVKKGTKRSYKKRTGGRKRKASWGKPCKSRYGRKLHTGKNGGKFYMCKGHRVYVKK